MPVSGSCLCGAVTFHVEGAVSDVVACYCSMCRKASGGAFGAFFVALRKDVTWHGDDHLTVFESSPKLVRAFCSHCGTAMTGANLIEPDDTIILAANALDCSADVRIVAHEHVASRARWDRDADQVRRFDDAFPEWGTLRP